MLQFLPFLAIFDNFCQKMKSRAENIKKKNFRVALGRGAWLRPEPPAPFKIKRNPLKINYLQIFVRPHRYVMQL